MRLTEREDHEKHEKVYVIRVRMGDLEDIHLDRFDKMLLNECNYSFRASDKLLALEMLCRRMEEQKIGGPK